MFGVCRVSRPAVHLLLSTWLWKCKKAFKFRTVGIMLSSTIGLLLKSIPVGNAVFRKAGAPRDPMLLCVVPFMGLGLATQGRHRP